EFQQTLVTSPKDVLDNKFILQMEPQAKDLEFGEVRPQRFEKCVT
ncbi:MAG: hypothetical protein ACI80H_001081, partial [Pseudoalteromonas distincta]